MIRFEHVTRRYEPAGRPALEDVSVEFNRGDFVFLIGASGSGKSTLLRMILREGLPQRGKVTVAGQNLGLMLERRVPDYRRSIGMVFQDFRLLPDKTVYDNVAFAMRVIGSRRARIRQRVTKVLERVELDHLAKRYPHEISGGEQQRAAIARALVNEPAILLADEPTGNLDPRASDEVMKILRWISVSGTTVVMATHDRAIVDRMRRRVVQLHDGHLVRDEERGTYDPPQGSYAWAVLRDEETSGGLRASDPRPALDPLTVTADAARTSAGHPTSPPAAVSTTTASDADADAEVDVDAERPDPPEVPHPSAPATSQREAPEPPEEPQVDSTSRETPEPPVEMPTEASEEGIRVTWPEHLRAKSAAPEVPEPTHDFDGTEMPDLDRDGYMESDSGVPLRGGTGQAAAEWSDDPGPAARARAGQEPEGGGAETGALRDALRQAVASHTTLSAGPEGAPEKPQLSWLAHADEARVDRPGHTSSQAEPQADRQRRDQVEDARLAHLSSADEPPGHEPVFSPERGQGPQPSAAEDESDGPEDRRSIWRRLRRTR